VCERKGLQRCRLLGVRLLSVRSLSVRSLSVRLLDVRWLDFTLTCSAMKSCASQTVSMGVLKPDEAGMDVLLQKNANLLCWRWGGHTEVSHTDVGHTDG